MFVDAALGEIVKKKKLPIGNWVVVVMVVVVVVVVVLERKKDRLFVYDFLLKRTIIISYPDPTM